MVEDALLWYITMNHLAQDLAWLLTHRRDLAFRYSHVSIKLPWRVILWDFWETFFFWIFYVLWSKCKVNKPFDAFRLVMESNMAELQSFSKKNWKNSGNCEILNFCEKKNFGGLKWLQKLIEIIDTIIFKGPGPKNFEKMEIAQC